MSDLLVDQYSRMLDDLPADDPWTALEASGYLDLLKEETIGGVGLPLEDLFPIALETGRRPAAPPVAAGAGGHGRAAQPRRGPSTRRLLAAGQMAAAMEAVQAMTVEYARMRKQFGREIGRFQAVQHQIAVMAEGTMAGRMAAQAAFIGLPSEVSEYRAAVAKLRCGVAAERVCAIAHAVHGAIGVSAEHSLHRHTRRLRAWRLAHGGEGWWAQRLGDWALSQTGDFNSLARAL